MGTLEHFDIFGDKFLKKEEGKFWGTTHGFALKFLERKIREVAKKGNWVAFNAIMVVMIYGIVLVPNIENCVDFAAICFFMNKNHVPTLFADTY